MEQRQARVSALILRRLGAILDSAIGKAQTQSGDQDSGGYIRPSSNGIGSLEREGRDGVKFSWTEANKIAEPRQKRARLDEKRKNRYASAVILASATGLRCAELYALRMNDVDFRAGTI